MVDPFIKQCGHNRGVWCACEKLQALTQDNEFDELKAANARIRSQHKEIEELKATLMDRDEWDDPLHDEPGSTTTYDEALRKAVDAFVKWWDTAPFVTTDDEIDQQVNMLRKLL